MIRRSEGRPPEVDMTPMIDCVFQLIIFFMVIMSIALVYGVAIKFPAAGQNRRADESKKEKQIYVYVQQDWIDQGHYLRRDGILKINGEEIALTISDDRNKWDDERAKAFELLRLKMADLIHNQGHKKDNMLIQGDVKTYHEKIMRVIDQAKDPRVGIDGFSLVPPTQ